MYKLLVVLLVTFTLLGSCSRSGRCDCVPPPVTESNWKMTQIFGGFAPMIRPMTDDQRNSILTITSTGRYACRNTITGETVSGGITLESVDPNLTRCTFSPLLPIYPVSSFWLLEKTDETMRLSDRNADGYTITFTRQ